jgi:hypothetical protein
MRQRIRETRDASLPAAYLTPALRHRGVLEEWVSCGARMPSTRCCGGNGKVTVSERT